MTPSLWDHIRSVRRDSTETTLRTASVLAQLDPSNSAWQDVATRVAQSLVQCEPTQVATWADLFMPVRNVLTDPLRSQFGTTDSVAEQRNLAEVYCLFAADDVARLSRACRDATPVQLSPIITSLRRHAASAVAALQGEFTAAANITRPADLGPFEALDSALVEQIDRWQGAVSASAAFVQTMPLRELDAVLERMGRAGYRPTSVRPFRRQRDRQRGGRLAPGRWAVAGTIRSLGGRTAAGRRLVRNQDLALADVVRLLTPARCVAIDLLPPGVTRKSWVAPNNWMSIWKPMNTNVAHPMADTADFYRDRYSLRQAQDDGRPLFTILWRKQDPSQLDAAVTRREDGGCIQELVPRLAALRLPVIDRSTCNESDNTRHSTTTFAIEAQATATLEDRFKLAYQAFCADEISACIVVDQRTDRETEPPSARHTRTLWIRALVSRRTSPANLVKQSSDVRGWV